MLREIFKVDNFICVGYYLVEIKRARQKNRRFRDSDRRQLRGGKERYPLESLNHERGKRCRLKMVKDEIQKHKGELTMLKWILSGIGVVAAVAVPIIMMVKDG